LGKRGLTTAAQRSRRVSGMMKYL